MDLAIRAVALFFFVYLLTRVTGRRELSSLEPFDLILLIVLGDAIQQGLTQDDYSVTGAIIVVGAIAALQVGTSFLSFKFPWASRVLDCGWQARSQVACIREAVRGIERTVAYCRSEERLRAFCDETGAEAGESHREPAEQD